MVGEVRKSVLGEIGVEPYFDPAVPVHANEVLDDPKVACNLI